MSKASVRNFVISSKMNKVRSITDGTNFVNSGAEDNKAKRQEVTKV
jgi:hypothetical protein